MTATPRNPLRRHRVAAAALLLAAGAGALAAPPAKKGATPHRRRPRSRPCRRRPRLRPPAAAAAPDRADLDRTQIIGNRELPKVLYIVPWKKPIPGDLSGRPPVSVLDEALAPVDRDVFRRQVDYDAQAQARIAPAAAAKPAK